ncbi:helix-turn-helix domain-containing protein [Sphingomonas sp.]
MTSEKFRFGDVAKAIGTSPKSLRNWLQRGQVQLSSPEPQGSNWRDFSSDDIAQLAIVRRLVDFGIEVRVADQLSVGILAGMELVRQDQQGDFRVTDYQVAVHPVRGDEGWQVIPICHPSEIQAAVGHSTETLLLSVGRIVAAALSSVINKPMIKGEMVSS